MSTRSTLHFLRRLGLVALGLSLLTAALAHINFLLSGSNAVDLGQLAALPAPPRQDRPPQNLNGVAEWTGARDFRQAPLLAERVAAGDVPAVAERLAQEHLRVAAAIAVGGDEERDAGFERGVRPIGR